MSKEKRRKDDIPRTRVDTVKDSAKTILKGVPISMIFGILVMIFNQNSEFKDIVADHYATSRLKDVEHDQRIDSNKEDIASLETDVKDLGIDIGSHKLDDAKNWRIKP